MCCRTEGCLEDDASDLFPRKFVASFSAVAAADPPELCLLLLLPPHRFLNEKDDSSFSRRGEEDTKGFCCLFLVSIGIPGDDDDEEVMGLIGVKARELDGRESKENTRRDGYIILAVLLLEEPSFFVCVDGG